MNKYLSFDFYVIIPLSMSREYFQTDETRQVKQNLTPQILFN